MQLARAVASLTALRALVKARRSRALKSAQGDWDNWENGLAP